MNIQNNYLGIFFNIHEKSPDDVLILVEICSFLYLPLRTIQGWAMKWEKSKGKVGLTVVECGGGELAFPLL